MGSQRKNLSNAELQLARDMGAATYLSSYIWLMAGELKVEDINNNSVNKMAELMVDPINLATLATFCMLMKDIEGANNAMQKLREALNDLRDA